VVRKHISPCYQDAMDRYPIINNGYQFVLVSMTIAVLIAVAGAWISARTVKQRTQGAELVIPVSFHSFIKCQLSFCDFPGKQPRDGRASVRVFPGSIPG